MRSWYTRRWLTIGFIYRARGLMTPPITGDPYSLSLPGQSRIQTLAMWARYLLALWFVTFVALLCVGLAAYPIAIAVRWLIMVLR